VITVSPRNISGDDSLNTNKPQFVPVANLNHFVNGSFNPEEIVDFTKVLSEFLDKECAWE
jgi:hypothetical protein